MVGYPSAAVKLVSEDRYSGFRVHVHKNDIMLDEKTNGYGGD